MSKGIEKRGYESVLVLPALDDNTSVGAGLKNSYFLPLPQAKRGTSPKYYARYISRNIEGVYQLASLIRREEITLLHANEIFDIYGALAARIAGVPCVWHVRADLSSTPLVRKLLSITATLLADAIIVVSESVRENMFQRCGINTKKVTVIYDPGPDPTMFHKGIDSTSIREEFGLDENAFIVTLVAKLSKRKGHETLIRSAPKVLAEFPNTYFLIVGGELEGSHHQAYAIRLKDLPRRLGIQDKVLFPGFRSDIPEIMTTSDIITHCSTYQDPFPGVVLQGMAVGKPVIASDLGGPEEQIKHGVSGMLVEPGNPTALAEAICCLLADEKRRRRLGEAAAARVNSMFTSELFFQRLSSLYDSLIA